MTGITRMSGMVAAGLLSLGVGVERFINALLADSPASYSSTRWVVAAVCTATGGVLFVLAAFRHGRGDKR